MQDENKTYKRDPEIQSLIDMFERVVFQQWCDNVRSDLTDDPAWFWTEGAD